MPAPLSAGTVYGACCAGTMDIRDALGVSAGICMAVKAQGISRLEQVYGK